jgi:formylglycine-generating enzyme required for sulfatase activity
MDRMKRRGRRVAVGVTALAIFVLGVATWQAWRLWPKIVFRWRFEALGANAAGYPEYRHRQTGIVMGRLPGGTFPMGSPEGEPWHESDEGPVHEVTLSPFLISKFEVTQGESDAVMGSYPSYFNGTKDADGNAVNPPDRRDRLPVEQVSWDDMQEFEKKTGLLLPTEAQWEYSCRGGTTTAFSIGSGESCADWECAPCAERDRYLWYCANSGRRTHEVGTKKANPFGLHDIHGDV